MKVLVLTNMYPSEAKPYSGVFVRDQVDALRAAGVSVDVLFVDGVADKRNYLRGILEFRRRIRTENYDLIHAHYVHSGWIARMQTKLPVVVTSHGSDTLGHEGWFLKKLYPLVDAVTITSKQNQDRIGLHDTFLLPCGIDTDQFAPEEQSKARQALNWDLNRKVMLYVGRDAPLKRLDILREAHKIVRQQRDDVDLVLATSVDHDSIPLYLNAADVFVFASETEGAPVVIKEAMACNLPIVSVDVGDVREVIEGTDGCLICERAPEAIAESVFAVFERSTRTNGREVALTYSNDAIARRILDIYSQVTSKA